MKLVIDTYGEFFWDGMVLVLLFILLWYGVTDDDGNHGIFAMAGEMLTSESRDYREYCDFSEGYLVESKKPAPQITYSGMALQTGLNRLSDCIKAYDDAGNELTVKIMSIIDMNGTDWIAFYSEDTTEIRFDSQGIYMVKVAAVSANKKRTICTIRIPVNP